MMTPIFIVLILAAISIFGLWVSWFITIGWLRSTLAILCRIAWLSPIFIALFPITTTFELPRSLELKPIHILVDDSDSMKKSVMGRSLLDQANDYVEQIKTNCNRLGCVPKVAYLSKEDRLTREGFTPLSRMIPSWIYKVGGGPWVLLTDGGDYQPSISWPVELKDSGIEGSLNSQLHKSDSIRRGVIIGFADDNSSPNIWIKDLDLDSFAFEDRPIFSSVVLKRSGDLSPLRVQVQIEVEGKILASVNASFDKDKDETLATLPIPPMPKGSHMLSVHALPTPLEKVLWDNVMHRHIEVMPNTVGVLHLLGSPSWDGRFLRRYLKAEPKYDLISFFILRDPWDSQQVNERELSLIPFPVARLFNEELPNFRMIVLQDFTLLQFLLPEYQNNLVQFVKEGGGLLFIGGERALLDMDIQNSPLKEILPFEVSNQNNSGTFFNPLMGDLTRESINKSGPWYDEELEFRIKLAQPDAHKRALANVYDEWEILADSLASFDAGKGLHHMENVTFRDNHYTPLLYAQTSDGKEIPLAVASYPGKGRAIWIFTDSMWRLALAQKANTPREIYHRFMQGAMTWVLRQDLKKPLIASGLQISAASEDYLHWNVHLQGAAVRYFSLKENWSISVCGAIIEEKNVLINKITEESWLLSGLIPLKLRGGQRCRLVVNGEHMAFGAVTAMTETIYPETFNDAQMPGSSQKLTQLAELTGAMLEFSGRNVPEILNKWIEDRSGKDGISLPGRFKTEQDFFWILKSVWIWLLLLGLPLEVLIRRWHFLTRRRVSKKFQSDAIQVSSDNQNFT